MKNDIKITICRYIKKKNAVVYHKVTSIPFSNKAYGEIVELIESINKPLCYYVDGMQDCDCFLRWFCHENQLYKDEQKKIND